ncbi:MAG: aspartate kinase [Actinomycetia bacterium]|nr:aspartate kinase [Actinomycetes bacterium]
MAREPNFEDQAGGVLPCIVVAKFGGTSLATPERLRRVAERLVSMQRQNLSVVAVVSAMGKSTDDLMRLALSINAHPPSRELDRLLATGEQVCMALLAMAIDALGACAVSLSGRQAGILTTAAYSKAHISEIKAERIRAELKAGRIVVVAGFQGITPSGDITTLGRGGSDTTAVAVAAGLKADICEIYSDVDGVYSADPRLVPRARRLEVISYEEMLELAASGAGVLHMRSVEVARNFKVPLYCRSAFSDEPGTLVREEQDMESAIISGIACDRSESKVTIRGVPDHIGIAAEVFGLIADSGVNIDMIVQNVSAGGATDISFTAPTNDLERLRPALDSIVGTMGVPGYAADAGIAKISLVGAGMRSSPGIAARMFHILAKEAINIDMISTSAIRISVVIDAARASEAMQALHTGFDLDSEQVFEETSLSNEELAAKMLKGR